MIEEGVAPVDANWRLNFLARVLVPLLAILIFVAIEYWGDLREQNLRSDLVNRGVRANGFVERFEGKGENVAVFHFHIADGRDIESSYDMTGSPERDRIAPAVAISVVYDPTSPERAIPEPFANVPPFDLVSDLRPYVIFLGGFYTVFLLPLALFGVWRDRQRREDS